MRQRYSLKMKSGRRRSRWLVPILAALVLVGGLAIWFGESPTPKDPDVLVSEKAAQSAPAGETVAESEMPEPSSEEELETDIPEDRVRIALVVPREGAFKEEGQMLRQGAELALAGLHEIDFRGDLTVPEVGNDPEEMINEMRLLAEDPKVLAVVAHLSAEVLAEVAPLYREKGLPLVVPANSHQSLAQRDGVIPLVPSDHQEAVFAAQIAARISRGESGRVAAVSASDGYGHLLMEAFREEARALGLSYRAYEWTGEPASDHASVSQLIQADTELVWLAGSPLWAKQVVQEAIQSDSRCRFLAPSSFDERFMEDLFGNCENRFLLIRPVVVEGKGDDDLAEFRKGFLERFWNEPDWLAVLGYETFAWMISCMADHRGTIDREGLRSCFLRHSGPDRAYPGLAGQVYFQPDGSVHRPLLIAVYRDGRFRPAPDELTPLPSGKRLAHGADRS